MLSPLESGDGDERERGGRERNVGGGLIESWMQDGW